MKLLWATNMQCESVERRIGEVFSKFQLEVELNHNLATKTDMTMFRLQDEGISATEVKNIISKFKFTNIIVEKLKILL